MSNIVLSRCLWTNVLIAKWLWTKASMSNALNVNMNVNVALTPLTLMWFCSRGGRAVVPCRGSGAPGRRPTTPRPGGGAARSCWTSSSSARTLSPSGCPWTCTSIRWVCAALCALSQPVGALCVNTFTRKLKDFHVNKCLSSVAERVNTMVTEPMVH